MTSKCRRILVLFFVLRMEHIDDDCISDCIAEVQRLQNSTGANSMGEYCCGICIELFVNPVTTFCGHT